MSGTQTYGCIKITAHANLPDYTSMERLLQHTTVVRQRLHQELGKVILHTLIRCSKVKVLGMCSPARLRLHLFFTEGFSLHLSVGIFHVPSV